MLNRNSIHVDHDLTSIRPSESLPSHEVLTCRPNIDLSRRRVPDTRNGLLKSGVQCLLTSNVGAGKLYYAVHDLVSDSWVKNALTPAPTCGDVGRLSGEDKELLLLKTEHAFAFGDYLEEIVVVYLVS